MENISQSSPWTLLCSSCGIPRTFKRKGAYTTALKLNNTVCYHCSLKTRTKRPTAQKVERTCPSCNDTITYKSKHHIDRARQQNSLCRKCYLKHVKKYEYKGQQSKVWYQQNKEYALRLRQKRRKEIQKKRNSGDLDTVLSLRLERLHKRAKSKGITLTLVLNDLKNCFTKQNGKCFYSGIPLDLTLKGDGTITDNPYQITVDRLDSAKGYDKDNVVLCCMVANSAKSVLSVKDFFSFIEKTYLTMKANYLQEAT